MMMRLLAYTGLGLVGVAVVAGAALWGILHYIQNNDMREWAAWGAAKAGVPVQFTGPVQVKLWPQLVVTTQGLRVDALQGEGKLASVDALGLQAAWGSGFKPWQGLQLRAIEAKNPTLNLQRNLEGQVNWALPEAANRAPVAASTNENPLQTLTAQGGVLASVRLAIQNLNLTYTDAQSGQRVEVKGMNIGARTEGTKATTTLKGAVNNQPLQGEMVADVADLASIPLKARLEGANAALALEGRVTQQANLVGFAGMVNARSGNLQSTLKTLLGKAPPQAPQSTAALTGDIVLKPEQVTLRNFSTRIGELLQARGDIEITLGATPGGKGTVAVQGANLRALAELASGAKQPTLPARPFNFQARLAGEKTIEVRDLVFNLEPVLQVRGSAQITPRSNGQLDISTNLNLSAPSLQALLQAFGQQQTAPAQAVQATLQVQGAGGLLTLQKVQAQLADLASLTLTGTADTQTAQPKLALDANLSGANMAAAAEGFGVRGNLPASGFSVNAKVRGAGPYELEGLTVNLPGLVQLLANLTYTAGNPANLAGDLKVAQFNATKLGFCGGSAAPAGTGSNGAASAGSAASPWSDEGFDLSALRTLALNLKIQLAGVSCEGLPLQNATMTLRNTPSQLDVNDLQLNLAENKGTVTGAISLVHAGTPRLNTQLALSKVHAEQFSPALAEKGVVLPLSGALQLVSQGASSQLLAQNLGGRIELSATDGRLPYTNILGNVVALERLLQGQASLPNNGNGEVDNLAMVVALRQGIGTFETLQVATGNGAMQLTGNGQIDLPNWAIDLTLTPKLATSSGLAVPVLVRGPLTAPAIGADPAFRERLTSRLATEGVKALLGTDKEGAKGLGGVVGDVLSGKGLTQEGMGNLLNQFVKPQEKEPALTAQASPTTPQEAPAAKPEEAPRPEELLLDALPGLLGQ